MKIKISYLKPTEEMIEVPKKYQFVYLKDEDEWTDKQWDLSEEWYHQMSRKYDEWEVEDIIE